MTRGGQRPPERRWENSYKPSPQLLLRVSSVQDDQMFFISTGAERVLIYANAAQIAGLRVGSVVEVRGTVPTDWVRLATHELRAIEVWPR